VSSVAAVESPDVIHSRLGHPSLSKLQAMVPSLSRLATLECQTCHLGKHVRSSFSSRPDPRAASPFSVIHSDVWGPSRVTSHLGFRYFVTFIDDFSRCTWLYLMKDRSELFTHFKSFCFEIQNQFQTSIKILRSDNAREYFSASFSSYLSSQGILHQSSCPHTPQQNGVAERKHRHLIETARTLLLHTHVPLKFWGEAILTACYLINRMPSSVLQNQVPHSILFPHEHIFSLPLRVFGCTCFVHDLTPGKDKLTARSVKCVFLGYTRFQKGYRCYSPTLNRFFVSADVTFLESNPFFSAADTTSPSISEVLPVPYLDGPLVPTKPLQVYHRRPRPAIPDDSSPEPVVAPSLDPPSDDSNSPPLAPRKGTRSTRNPHPIYNFLCYHRLSSPHYAFTSALSSVSIPKTQQKLSLIPDGARL